jgi:hypothetical protein
MDKISGAFEWVNDPGGIIGEVGSATERRWRLLPDELVVRVALALVVENEVPAGCSGNQEPVRIRHRKKERTRQQFHGDRVEEEPRQRSWRLPPPRWGTSPLTWPASISCPPPADGSPATVPEGVSGDFSAAMAIKTVTGYNQVVGAMCSPNLCIAGRRRWH